MQLSAISLALTRLGWLSAFTPASLFTTGVNGAWYDPSDYSTLYQNAAGTTPVTAVEQPVGLMLDKRDTAYSTYFDGTGDYLTAPTSTSFEMGAGDYTLECWIYPTNNSDGGVVFKGLYKSGPWDAGFGIRRFSATQCRFYFNTTSSSATEEYVDTTSSNQTPANTWHHLAMVVSGSVGYAYINGQLAGTKTGLTAITTSTAGTTVGAFPFGSSSIYFAGYISNVRIVKGTALYTANFTPPTAPLTPVAGTSLLTCGNTWSGNPAITAFGNVRADKLNPFKTGTGNHAFNGSGNSANFPVLSCRYNVLNNTETLSTQSVTTRAAKYILSFWGTGSVALSGTYTGTLAGTGTDNRVYVEFTATAGTLTLTVTGSVLRAQLEEL